MDSKQEFYALFRDTKWIIAISLLVSAILYVPDQVRELYRISGTQTLYALTQLVALLAIAITIWHGAFQVVSQSANLRGPFKSKLSQLLLRLLPVILGTLPLAFAALAQLASRPKTLSLATAKTGFNETDLTALREVGSIFRIQENALNSDAATLLVYFFVLAAIATLFAGLTWWLGRRPRVHAAKLNANYFEKHEFFLLTVALIAAVTTAFLFSPVRLPQVLGVFGILAVFTICIVSFCIHLSLLTIKHEIPFLPIIFAWCLLLAFLDVNDNHSIRTMPAASDGGGKADNSSLPPRLLAGDAFVKWLQQPHRLNYAKARSGSEAKKYPVFIITAQGGGIYAAYNAGIFLARMQDLCPTFRNHIFAISSVSGGSIGAATFASALHAGDQTANAAIKARQLGSDGPCPDLAEFLSGAHSIRDHEAAGRMEIKVDSALSSDFLSPLIAGTLFADFTQGFVPYPIGPFDRARTLEFALEDAVGKMYPDLASGKSKPNLAKEDYQNHWSPDKAIPALLMNATDSGSGKRVLIAPFDLHKQNSAESDLCMLSAITLESKGADTKSNAATPRFSLSTAAFISARFPWVTPAATIQTSNSCITQNNKVRLVDGGYVDNSGVESALDLAEEIKAFAKQARQQNQDVPEFEIYLLSLSGGGFPDHGAFSFNEIAEPIRALLSGRESRAYIALGRAASQSLTLAKQDELPSHSRANLNNHFYDLPLGWAMSAKTRAIIAQDSGRYWDCEPGKDFLQSRKHLSNADCIQLQVYHLLNGSVKAAIAGQKSADRIAALVKDKVGSRISDPRYEKLLSCYEENWVQARSRSQWVQNKDRWEKGDKKGMQEFPPYKEPYLSYYQSAHVRELLREWDVQPEKDPHILAYILGSISYDSDDFRRTTESLSFSSEKQIRKIWQARIEAINAARKKKDPKASDVDLSKLVNNPPGLANLVWGWPDNKFGNRPENGDDSSKSDAWRYRPRGIYQILGREQFVSHGRWLKLLYSDFPFDITEEPDALVNKTVSAKVVYAHFHHRRYAGESLIQRLKSKPSDWAAARKFQTDMHDSGAGSEKELIAVQERSAMFSKCIEAMNKK